MSHFAKYWSRLCATAASAAALAAVMFTAADALAQTQPAAPVRDAIPADAIALTPEQAKLFEQMTTIPVLPQYYYPSLGAGIPTGFGANWGDIMIGATWANSDKIRNQADGSMSFTMGFLNAADFVGLEVSANVLSMRSFGQNINFDAKLHRILLNDEAGILSVALGRNNFACSGTEVCSSTVPVNGLAPNTASNYLVFTGLTPLRLESGTVLPLKASLGAGNGYYATDTQKSNQFNVFGDVGLQFHNQVGASVGWSGVGLNSNLSFVPVSEWPLIINVLFADITNRTPAGFNVAVSVGVPLNFLNR